MDIREKLESGFVFFDGGFGTLLQAAGLKPGELPERWNLEKPETISKLHYDYLLAGANILKTNTFGANSFKYPNDDSEYGLKNIVTAGIACARRAIS